MDVGQMQRQWVDYIKSLFLEGFLDGQFLHLQKLQDESTPDFVVEVVSIFFDETEKLLNDVTTALEQPSVDFRIIGGHVYRFKGSSSSVGAQRVKDGCIAFRNYCEEENIEGCIGCLQELKQEYYLVKDKLQTLFAMEQQIVAAGGSIPMLKLDI
ncbi:PREDICTED: histidine-containing phosphotransfer protein 1-like [Fragaria vesca subsp. vesca]|uniref:histidine-containing phosphotransfer protein 1-like n=1 Tax=Fragaria vesca subsp. vesca TaxID=101020 RepID=UPI0002C30AE4|nr:PREDICTED: histidine-containing phosphotransfer protein 1-like [Fragaria vesca subsp. vesca]